MNRVDVIVPSQLRHVVEGNGRISIEAETVGGALKAFAAHSTIINDNLFDADGNLQRFARVFVNGEPSSFEDGEDEPVPAGSTISVLVALVGG